MSQRVCVRGAGVLGGDDGQGGSRTGEMKLPAFILEFRGDISFTEPRVIRERCERI